MPDPGRPEQSRRSIRSFVLRKGRLTDAQARALEELWPEFGIDNQAGVLDSSHLFGRDAPLVLEIGFGNGEATWRMARNEPQKDFIGVEVHKPGVGQLLRAVQTHGLENVRIACTDAALERSRSVSSIRNTNTPCCARACSQQNKAVRAPPTCR